MGSSLLPLLVFLSFLTFSTHKLVIQSPPELKTLLESKFPDGVHYSVANYGDVPFGKSLGGTIYLSSYLENCKFEPLSDEAQRSLNKIVLSTRGDCTFTTKSLHSQKQGAKLAIIADNDATQDPGRVIMVDDGKGPQVKIPTILISQQVGAIIIDFITTKNKSVSLLVNFETFKKDKANVTIWMSSFDRKSYILVRQLEPYFNRISDSIQLSVYHPTTYCNTCPPTDCYGDNSYCINTGYEGYIIEGYGQQIIKQQLREQLILKKYPRLWWKYVETYDEQCDDKRNIQQCSTNVMNSVGSFGNEINKQVYESFEAQTVTDEQGKETQIYENKILQSNDELRYKSGILIFPGITVNNIAYRGNLDALQIFQLICQSLTNVPSGCNLSIEPKTENVWKYVVPITIIFVVFMIFIIFCYRRHVRRELSKNLNTQVNDLVNQYITMYETQRFEGQEMPNVAK